MGQNPPGVIGPVESTWTYLVNCPLGKFWQLVNSTRCLSVSMWLKSLFASVTKQMRFPFQNMTWELCDPSNSKAVIQPSPGHHTAKPRSYILWGALHVLQPLLDPMHCVVHLTFNNVMCQIHNQHVSCSQTKIQMWPGLCKVKSRGLWSFSCTQPSLKQAKFQLWLACEAQCAQTSGPSTARASTNPSIDCFDLGHYTEGKRVTAVLAL